MIAGTNSRSILVLPRRVWRVVKAKAPKPAAREKRAKGTGLLEALEQMLSYQVDLAFREYRD